MMNKEDPFEWLYQIEVTPVSAHYIVKTLTARVKSLGEINEELRNENIDLRKKFDTGAFQKEAEELKRQLRALSRLTKRNLLHQEAQDVILTWTEQGFVFAVEGSSFAAGQDILLPQTDKISSKKFRLLRASVADDILYLTNTGRVGIFEVRSLLRAGDTNLIWQKLPDITLAEKEFISIMMPVGLLPLSDYLITLSLDGYIRSIYTLNINQFIQKGNLGKGIKDDRDAQTFARLIFNKQEDMIIFTNQGKYLRFPSESLSPSITPALKLDISEYIVGMITSDEMYSQILVLDHKGKGARRSIHNFARQSLGRKPKQGFSTGDLIGAQLVNQDDHVVVLISNEKMSLKMLNTTNFPLDDRSHNLIPVPELEGYIHDFAIVETQNVR